MVHPLDVLGNPSLQELVVSHLPEADAVSFRKVCTLTRNAGIATITPGHSGLSFCYNDKTLVLKDDSEFDLDPFDVGEDGRLVHFVRFRMKVSGSSGVSNIAIARDRMTLIGLDLSSDSLNVFLTPLCRVLCARATEYVTMFAAHDPYPTGYTLPIEEEMLQHCASADYAVPPGLLVGPVFQGKRLRIASPNAWTMHIGAKFSGFHQLSVSLIRIDDHPTLANWFFFTLSNTSLTPILQTPDPAIMDMVRAVLWNQRAAIAAFAREVMEAPIVIDLPATIEEFVNAVQTVHVS